MWRFRGGLDYCDLARVECADEVAHVDEVHDLALRSARAVVDRQLLHEGRHAGCGAQAEGGSGVGRGGAVVPAGDGIVQLAVVPFRINVWEAKVGARE